jgi:hypothetical protein
MQGIFQKYTQDIGCYFKNHPISIDICYNSKYLSRPFYTGLFL